VLVPVFGGIPAIALLSNLLAAPLAEPLTVYGLVASLALSIGVPLRPLGTLVHVPTTLMVRWVTFVARTCAQVPFVLDARAIAGVLAVAGAAAGVAKAAGTLRRDAE
jgi:predicted membrane metal-binding protein